MLKNFGSFDKKTYKKLTIYYESHPQILKKPLSPNDRIAYISSPNLGDTLIGLVTVNNLLRNGYQVDVYGDYAYALRDWFPQFKIFPSVLLEEQRKLKKYTVILHMHERNLSKELAAWHPNSVVLYHNPLFCFTLSEVVLQGVLCECQLGLQDVVNTNGMQTPLYLIKNRNDKRIMIHPTSNSLLRNWHSKKFMQLARVLCKRGYNISFVLADGERAEWGEIIKGEFDMPRFSSLSELAANLYESGYFIGNDSGVGHLASSVGLPTLSIIIRKGLALHWRPAWSKSEIVMPPCWLNPRFLREKFWKNCTSVSRVLAKFDCLCEYVLKNKK